MYEDRAVSAPSQMPIVGQGMDRLARQQAELLLIVKALEERLTIVMREPEPSQPQGNEKDTGNARSQFGVLLNDRIEEAKHISDRLTAILRRLEI